MSVTALKPKNAVESLRDIVQDLVVPELKALKAEMESQRRANHTQFEAIRTELKPRDDRQAEATQALRTEMSIRFEQLSDRIITALDLRERLAILEDRAKRT